ncbi:uncharacterized protein LOC129779437 [Toxorhynchites rutilus septentrionalis]|uniref:uncharacterized protein LOC129779437 n=1 Tax=Toxorhynchites rutilus septentrionalis TaxID=329112 RepID=UPI002478E78E|nr:uncharacterized protein LOC129779437 [Toxorhynchites rutilus septentrionalis]
MPQYTKVVGLPPLKYNWGKAYLIRPVDNIISHPDALLKRPFRPSFEYDGDPNIACLLRYDYFRIWKQEHCAYQACKCKPRKQPIKKFSPYRKKPIKATYCGGKCANDSKDKCRFIMKKFQGIPAKVDNHGVDASMKCQEKPNCCALSIPVGC